MHIWEQDGRLAWLSPSHSDHSTELYYVTTSLFQQNLYLGLKNKGRAGNLLMLPFLLTSLWC